MAHPLVNAAAVCHSRAMSVVMAVHSSVSHVQLMCMACTRTRPHLVRWPISTTHDSPLTHRPVTACAGGEAVADTGFEKGGGERMSN